MDKKPEALDLARIDAEEFARLETDARALEHEVQAERDEEARLAVLDKVWREQEEYSRAVEGLKPGRKSRRAPTIAVAVLIAAGIVGAVVYSYQTGQDRVAEAVEVEALRLAAASLARREADERAKRAAEMSVSEAGIKPAPALGEDPQAKASANEDTTAAAEKAKALALRIREEARRKAELQKQAEAMAQAEERARAVSAANVKEAPRAAPPAGSPVLAWS